MTNSQSIFSFKIESLYGDTIDFSSYKGKKILIVNVASECGYTSQYQQLQELSEIYADQLVVVGIPCNDFGNQEPGSNEDIAQFCSKNYQIGFPISVKVKIKGDEIHPIYHWLTHKSYNGVMDAEVRWNFTKFLLDEEGKLIATFPSSVSPLDDKILHWLQS